MRISDWSSDVCSSDLCHQLVEGARTMTRNHKTRKAATMLAIIGLAAPPALAQQPIPIPQAGPPAAQQAAPEPQVIAIPVPLPLPGQLKSAPQAKPPHAAGRARPTRTRSETPTSELQSLL